MYEEKSRRPRDGGLRCSPRRGRKNLAHGVVGEGFVPRAHALG
jgi:hypothetical protein